MSAGAGVAAPRTEATIGPPIAPFAECPNLGYMFASETGGQSTLSYYDIGTATLEPIKDLEKDGASYVVNAAGYSKPQNVFWAVRAVKNPPTGAAPFYPDELVRVDSLGNVDNIGAPGNLAALGFDDFLSLAGTVEGNTMYVHTKVPANYVFAIDVDPASPTLGTIISAKELSRTSPNNPNNMINIGDWDYNDVDGELYGVELSGGKRNIVKVNPNTGVVTDVVDASALLPASTNYGAVFMEDGTSTMYASANDIGGGASQSFEVRLDFSPPVVNSFGKGSSLRINDGADCLLATDFGDAPSSFKTRTAEGGPAHVLSSVFDSAHKLRIGSLADADLDGFPSESADADDRNIPGINDEDGVPAATVFDQAGGLTVPITNTTGQAATLAGWLDLDHSGTFEPGERAKQLLDAKATTATLVWPATQSRREEVDGQTFLRLRLFPGAPSDPLPTGWVDGGEMEDHLVGLRTIAAGANVVGQQGPAPVPGGDPVAFTGPASGAGQRGAGEWVDGEYLVSTGTSIRPFVVLGAGLLGFGVFILGVAWMLGRRSPNDQ